VPFEKSNKLGARKILKRPLDSSPTCVKLYQGHKEALQAVDGWQELVRGFIENLINSNEPSSE